MLHETQKYLFNEKIIKKKLIMYRYNLNVNMYIKILYYIPTNILLYLKRLYTVHLWLTRIAHRSTR